MSVLGTVVDGDARSAVVALVLVFIVVLIPCALITLAPCGWFEWGEQTMPVRCR